MTVARSTEITAMSNTGFDDAIAEGIRRATKSLRNVKSAWVKDQEVVLNGDKVADYKVTMKVTFVLDD